MCSSYVLVVAILTHITFFSCFRFLVFVLVLFCGPGHFRGKTHHNHQQQQEQSLEKYLHGPVKAKNLTDEVIDQRAAELAKAHHDAQKVCGMCVYISCEEEEEEEPCSTGDTREWQCRHFGRQ